ncbi:MAG TPA: PIN domain-containing protein [Thermoanaerobaculia bacterium]|nr:PIN domain-containing protein [Thermoanaerobaculia bacterium]
MKITFLDAGVLIAAFRGNSEVARRALAIMDDPDRSFASSVFVRLEVVPKALFHGRMEELVFYESFFGGVTHWAEPVTLTERAFSIATENGLSALDALHAAAALSVKASEIITSEKTRKPIHRVSGVTVTSIQPE